MSRASYLVPSQFPQRFLCQSYALLRHIDRYTVSNDATAKQDNVDVVTQQIANSIYCKNSISGWNVSNEATGKAAYKVALKRDRCYRLLASTVWSYLVWGHLGWTDRRK